MKLMFPRVLSDGEDLRIDYVGDKYHGLGLKVAGASVLMVRGSR